MTEATAHQDIAATDETIDTDDGPMPAKVAVPHGNPNGAVVVVQEAFGLTHHIADVAKIISTALGAGVDRIDRVEYEASSLTTVEAELMPKAIKDARQKAEALAHDTGLTLGEPIRVVQLPDTSVSAVVAAGNTVPGQMSPPKIEARLRVRVVYAAKRSSG